MSWKCQITSSISSSAYLKPPASIGSVNWSTVANRNSFHWSTFQIVWNFSSDRKKPVLKRSENFVPVLWATIGSVMFYFTLKKSKQIWVIFTGRFESREFGSTFSPVSLPSARRTFLSPTARSRPSRPGRRRLSRSDQVHSTGKFQLYYNHNHKSVLAHNSFKKILVNYHRPSVGSDAKLKHLFWREQITGYQRCD